MAKASFSFQPSSGKYTIRALSCNWVFAKKERSAAIPFPEMDCGPDSAPLGAALHRLVTANLHIQNCRLANGLVCELRHGRQSGFGNRNIGWILCQVSVAHKNPRVRHCKHVTRSCAIQVQGKIAPVNRE